jgi:hypothetical protein
MRAEWAERWWWGRGGGGQSQHFVVNHAHVMRIQVKAFFFNDEVKPDPDSCKIFKFNSFYSISIHIIGYRSTGKPVTSFADSDSLDPYVFRSPGSVSASQMYGSGSGSFYHQAKMLRKTFIPTGTVLFCGFFMTFIFEK